jgi:hypothetical protein
VKHKGALGRLQDHRRSTENAPQSRLDFRDINRTLTCGVLYLFAKFSISAFEAYNMLAPTSKFRLERFQLFTKRRDIIAVVGHRERIPFLPGRAHRWRPGMIRIDRPGKT